MNSFADAFFSILLSWVRSLTNAAWTAFRSGGQQGILSWLADHWLGLLILATLTGLTLDWIIWMLRWRPYRLWFNGFRRRRAPWKGTGASDSTPVYGDAYEDPADALESAPEADALSPDAPFEPEPDMPAVEASWSAPEAPNAAYARPAHWTAPHAPQEEEVFQEEAPADGWAPEGPAEETEDIDLSAQADDDLPDGAWASQDEVPDEMPEEATAEPIDDAPAFGRPGLWPGFGWARPKPAEEASSPQRRRRSARWQPPAEALEDPIPPESPAQELPELEAEEAPPEAVAAAYWEDPYEQEAEAGPDGEESSPESSKRRKRSSFRSDVIRTVTGAPAKRRGIMRLAESEDEAIPGLPPMMAREDAYRQPALPKKQKTK